MKNKCIALRFASLTPGDRQTDIVAVTAFAALTKYVSYK